MRIVTLPIVFGLSAACCTGAYAEAQKLARSAALDQTVAVVGGAPVVATKLDELVGNQLIRPRTEEYNIRRRVLEDHITALLLEGEAAARKISVAELVRTEIDERTR